MKNLEDDLKAYVIVSYNPKLIQQLEGIPQHTEKVYFQMLSLKIPEGSTLEHFAEIIAQATNSKLVDNLEMKRILVFTPYVKEAMTFDYHNIDQEVERLKGETGDLSFRKEQLDEEYIPF